MFDIPRLQGRRRSLHDQVFKDLIGRFLPDFLTLVAPEPAGRLDLSHWKLLDKEIFTDWPKGRRRELDLLAEVPLAGRRTGRLSSTSRSRPGPGRRWDPASRATTCRSDCGTAGRSSHPPRCAAPGHPVDGSAIGPSVYSCCPICRGVPGQRPAARLGAGGPDAAGVDEPGGAQDGLPAAHRRRHP